MTVFHVAIIGAGQRGITVLERIGSLYEEAPLSAEFVVHLIDPADSGQGVHRTGQPHHLMTNTSAHQTTIFADASVLGAGPEAAGPSYGDWLAGARRHDGPANSADELAQPDLFTPRALLGEYLKHTFRIVLARLPYAVAVTEHRSAAVDIRRDGPDAYRILLDTGRAITVSYVFICTGHGTGAAETMSFCSRRARREGAGDGRAQAVGGVTTGLDDIDRGARVLVVGAGLTAIDVVSTLTLGRGGRFEPLSKRRSRYLPSGDEPKMTLCSRQGLPPLCKGRSETSSRRKYAPRFFTEAFVRASRRSKGQLDWENDLWPALKRDMIDCFALAAGASSSGEAAEALIGRWLRPWRGCRIGDRQAHKAFIERYVADDLDDAFQGASSNPRKAVTEMLRDLNDVVRTAVDHAGLTPASHEGFLRGWAPINNRIAAGPPKERGVQLLALLQANVVQIFEPAPLIEIDTSSDRAVARSTSLGYESEETFDAVVEARVRPFDLTLTTDPLFAAGRDEGLWTAFRNGSFKPGGLFINEDLNVLERSGRPTERIWALGHCVEGAHYYTYVLPAPRSNSRNLRDCAKAARAMLTHARRTITEGEKARQGALA